MRTFDIKVKEIGFQNFNLAANVQCNVQKESVVTFIKRKHIDAQSILIVDTLIHMQNDINIFSLL